MLLSKIKLLLILMLLPKYVFVESDVVPEFVTVTEGFVFETDVVAEFVAVAEVLLSKVRLLLN